MLPLKVNEDLLIICKEMSQTRWSCLITAYKIPKWTIFIAVLIMLNNNFSREYYVQYICKVQYAVISLINFAFQLIH
jgi:hypothetical protein